MADILLDMARESDGEEDDDEADEAAGPKSSTRRRRRAAKPFEVPVQVRYFESVNAERAVHVLTDLPMGPYDPVITMDPGSKDRTRVLVSGITYYREDLKKIVKRHFETIGKVAFIKLGIGTASYERRLEAQRAIAELDGSVLRGRTIQVRRSPDPIPRQVLVLGLDLRTNRYEMEEHFRRAGDCFMVDAPATNHKRKFLPEGADRRQLWGPAGSSPTRRVRGPRASPETPAARLAEQTWPEEDAAEESDGGGFPGPRLGN